jgi:NAD(P)-dependent dehydrogenase (short-subunit alcohol dehydrogenase family)
MAYDLTFLLREVSLFFHQTPSLSSFNHLSLHNSVFPSEMSAPVLELMASKNNGKLPASFVPAERAGTEEDMAGAVLYMCSKAGAYLNGNVLIVDGGRVSVMPASY